MRDDVVPVARCKKAAKIFAVLVADPDLEIQTAVHRAGWDRASKETLALVLVMLEAFQGR